MIKLIKNYLEYRKLLKDGLVKKGFIPDRYYFINKIKNLKRR